MSNHLCNRVSQPISNSQTSQIHSLRTAQPRILLQYIVSNSRNILSSITFTSNINRTVLENRIMLNKPCYSSKEMLCNTILISWDFLCYCSYTESRTDGVIKKE
ncbi:hypothetical protein AAHE18_15G127200 [Arachis hypogaea]|nr:uncharacterized protein DS421_15g500320 [Arachis hypogaea]